MISQGVPCNLEYSFCDLEKISVGAISQRQRRDSELYAVRTIKILAV